MTASHQRPRAYSAPSDRRAFLKLGSLAVVALATPRLRAVAEGTTTRPVALPHNGEATAVSWQELADPGWSY